MCRNTETEEIVFEPMSGFGIMTAAFLMLIVSIGLIVLSIVATILYLLILAIPMCLFSFILFSGYFTLQPNEAMVLILFGKYKGTVKTSGFFWANPFLSKTPISLRSRNLNGDILTVNDKAGNPIQIAAVVVWKVRNTCKAIFDIDNYDYYVRIQSESAVRHLACSFAYDKHDPNEISLRSGDEQVTKILHNELTERLAKAGIEVEEARISHLAYSKEIASVMLRRQQAEAVIAARETIVAGAVSIVGHALSALETNNIVKMTNEEKSKLVSNLLVVLCSESQVHPVVNSGS